MQIQESMKLLPEHIKQMLKRRSFGKTFTMWLFLGIFGGHYFYLYQVESGLIYLFTLGGFGIAWLSDIFVLSQLVFQTNQLVDHLNRRLLEQERRFGTKTIIDGEFVGHMVCQILPTPDDGELETEVDI